MDWLSASIGAIGSLANTGLSAGLSAASDAAASQRSYYYSMKLQRAAQKWQESMSNTAHQREVADLRAAGLNPILSAGGSGASFSNASGASVSSPSTVSGALDNDGFLNAVRVGIEGENAESSARQAQAALGQSQAANAQAKVASAAQKSQDRLNQSQVSLNQAKADTERAHARMFDAQAKELHKTPFNRLGGDALNSIKDFFNSSFFQNGAARIFMNQRDFNKRVDFWYNQRRSEWHSRRNSGDYLKVPSQKDEVYYNGFKR